MLAGICNTIIALISSFHLSPPVICPMNNESQIYTDQVEVSIEQPDYIPSEKASLLNPEYTRMGGALYYLPNGNEYGYHYV